MSTTHAKADISRIIKYAPAELIGREAETGLLDDAWDKAVRGEAKRPHVLTFVALGGEGKTSLVAKWAAELAYEDWRSCEAAFAWSFYSQGTRDQAATSSDVLFKEALTFFGDAAMAVSAVGAFEKGQRLATLVGEKQALLILDGLEPLQYSPTSPMPGELKDQGLAALLKGLASSSRGLCIVTTRYSIPDLRAYLQTTAPEEKLKRLSKEAGVALLKKLGVKTGSKEEFEQLVEDVDGHVLTLQIMGGFLKKAFHGDIRCRDRVKFEKADAKVQGGHAFRVIAAYEKWMQDESEESRRELAILRLMGLFDRPAVADCVSALLKAPAIEGLTEPLTGLNEEDWNCSLDALETAGLLTVNRDAAGTLLSLDAHPLLREYFAKRLGEGNPDAWRTAHRRLYEHLCETTKEGDEPTLEDLQPLYQAVVHGCQAGLQHEACDKVYMDRILRGTRSGGFYSTRKLGAVGSDLGAVACFFETLWSRVSPMLTEADQAWLFNEAASRLRAMGRLTEALEPMRAGLEMRIKQETWNQAAISAGNLSELELTLGDVAGAVVDAGHSVTYADRSGDWDQRMGKRATHADALHQVGSLAEAELLFNEAEKIQVESQPGYPLLYSVQGFQYCDLLLNEAERGAGKGIQHSAVGDRNSALINTCRAVSERAMQTLKWAKQHLGLLSNALNHLTLGRAALYAYVLEPSSMESRESAIENTQAAVTGLRRAGAVEFLSRCLITRAWLRGLTARLTGPESCQSDLDEAWEIAGRGPMPLHMADILLYRARIFSREADYPWGSPQADLAQARLLIEKHGYSRRKGELEDAEAALKSYADLKKSSDKRKVTMHTTVIELDLVGYSTICENLEQGLDVNTVPQLNQQIQSFIDAGLKAVSAIREQTLASTTGDGAILVFDSAQDAHRFARAVHAATAEHNRTRNKQLAKRVFRSGAATGNIVMRPRPGGGFEIAGSTIARAVRLEAKALPGALLVDETTYQNLPASQQAGYGAKTRVTGKRDEEFDAYACQLNPDGPKDADFFIQLTSKDNVPIKVSAAAMAIWRKKLDFLLTEEAMVADAEQKFSISQRIEEARRRIQELGGQSQ